MNYRGTVELGIVTKLFEKIVTKQLAFTLNTSVSLFQYAFLKGRSTVTSLLELTAYIFKAFSRASQRDLAYMDFRKAFDIVTD